MAYQNPFFNSHFYNEFNSHINAPPPPPPPPTESSGTDGGGDTAPSGGNQTSYTQPTAAAYITPAAVAFTPVVPVVMAAFPMQNGYHQQQQFAQNNNNGFRGKPRFNNTNKRKSNNYNNNQHQGKRMKEEHFIAFCDVCDRGFKTQEKKEEHYREHKKCDHPGCKFEAHFKIVAMHYKNMHGPNSFNIRVSTPEEIQKWREERKKNYPTHGRVQEKSKLEKENIARGAVLKQESFGKFNKNKRNQNKHNRNNKKNQKFNTYRTERVVKEEPVGDENTNTPNGKKENDMSMSIDSVGIPAIKTEHGVKETKAPPKPDEIKSVVKDVGALKSLMFCYSDSESDSEQNDDQKVDDPSNDATQKEQNNDIIRNPSTKEEIHHDIVESTEHQNEQTEECQEPVKQQRNNRNKNNRRNQKQQQRNRIPPKRPSLLRKLLEPEIRKERNDILQCIRYIVENNFFDDLPPPIGE